PTPTPVRLGARRGDRREDAAGEEGRGRAAHDIAGAGAPVGILTGAYGARILAPLVDDVLRHERRGGLDGAGVRIIPVENRYFGVDIAVAGLIVGEDVARTLEAEPAGHRYLLPDVCLSRGVFLDGMSPEDLPRRVEVVPTDGVALRRALLEERTERRFAVSSGATGG
ncbi:MAG: DUF512 domain-containing protein, partial [Actinobacteria bacterium]|nr:DUF512 domain-containing protein [Actinomycetota bacterium]